jgi:hypothetical protein
MFDLAYKSVRSGAVARPAAGSAVGAETASTGGMIEYQQLHLEHR